MPYLVRACRLLWNTAPGWLALWLALLLLSGFLPVTTVYLSREIVDRLAAVLGAGQHVQALLPVLKPLLGLLGVLLLLGMLRSGAAVTRAQFSQLVQDRISLLIQEKSVALELSFYDQADYYDKLHRARNDAAHRPMELIESMGTLLQNSITLLAMASVLIPYSALAPVALLISTLPALYVVLAHRLRFYAWNLRNTEPERRTWYYDWILTSREHAAEIRVFSLSRHFQKAFAELRQRLRRESLQLFRAQTLAELGSSCFALLVTGLAMAWMVWRAIAGAVTIGDLALFYQAFNQGQNLLRSLLNNVGQMYSSSLFLADFFAFLDLAPQIRDPAEPLPLPARLSQGIRFAGVSFRYPGGRRPVVANFNFFIPANRVTALVGANGAGKSTLIKLLCRLYEPEAGTITYDGIDIRRCLLDDVRRNVTVLFQDPVRFNATLAENIWLGDIASPRQTEAIDHAARSAGADALLPGLADGYETRLGRWFADSTDLSGGEWQRVALARAFFRQSPIIVLDEPTSAMDSWSEFDWLERFKLLARGRTALLVTHRLTTAMRADIIHVLENGKIVESGSHHDLLRLDGRYASSWRNQMQGGA
ncbi:MAG: ABC transporter ATP-binding protein [Desulfobulbaceae bacterium]